MDTAEIGRVLERISEQVGQTAVQMAELAFSSKENAKATADLARYVETQNGRITKLEAWQVATLIREAEERGREASRRPPLPYPGSTQDSGASTSVVTLSVNKRQLVAALTAVAGLAVAAVWGWLEQLQ